MATLTIVVALPHVADGAPLAARNAVLTSASSSSSSSTATKRVKTDLDDHEDVARALGHTYDVTLQYDVTKLDQSYNMDYVVATVAHTKDGADVSHVVLWMLPEHKQCTAERRAFRTSRWLGLRIFAYETPMMTNRVITGFALIRRVGGGTVFAVEHCDAAHPGRADAEDVAFIRYVKITYKDGTTQFEQQTLPRSPYDVLTVVPPDGYHSRTIRYRNVMAAYETSQANMDAPAVRKALDEVASSRRPWSQFPVDELALLRASLRTPGAGAGARLNDMDAVWTGRTNATVFHAAIILTDSLEVVKTLMTAGARLDTGCHLYHQDGTTFRGTPLHLAVERYERRPESEGFAIVLYMVKNMVERGRAIPPDVGHCVMRFQQYSEEEMRWFMTRGVAFDGASDPEKNCPIHDAIEFNILHGEALQKFWTTLTALGMRFDHPGSGGKRPINTLMQTPFATKDAVIILRALKNAGVDLNADVYPVTPLIASLQNHRGSAKAFYEVVGDAWNYKFIYADGTTSLWAALTHPGARANLSDVEFLLARGVDPKQLDNDGLDVFSDADAASSDVLVKAKVERVYRFTSNRRRALQWANRMIPLMSASSAPILGHEARNLLIGPGPGHDGDDAVKRGILCILLEMGVNYLV